MNLMRLLLTGCATSGSRIASRPGGNARERFVQYSHLSPSPPPSSSPILLPSFFPALSSRLFPTNLDCSNRCEFPAIKSHCTSLSLPSSCSSSDQCLSSLPSGRQYLQPILHCLHTFSRKPCRGRCGRMPKTVIETLLSVGGEVWRWRGRVYDLQLAFSRGLSHLLQLRREYIRVEQPVTSQPSHYCL